MGHSFFLHCMEIFLTLTFSCCIQTKNIVYDIHLFCTVFLFFSSLHPSSCIRYRTNDCPISILVVYAHFHLASILFLHTFMKKAMVTIICLHCKDIDFPFLPTVCKSNGRHFLCPVHLLHHPYHVLLFLCLDPKIVFVCLFWETLYYLLIHTSPYRLYRQPVLLCPRKKGHPWRRQFCSGYVLSRQVYPLTRFFPFFSHLSPLSGRLATSWGFHSQCRTSYFSYLI